MKLASAARPETGRRVRKTPGQLAAENEQLRLRLEEAEETLRAIRAGEVDALVVSAADGEQIFTLQGADRTYRALIEQMNEGALTLAPDGLILYANRHFAAMTQAPLSAVIGTMIQAWVVPEDREALQALLRQAAQGKAREEFQLAAVDGTRLPVYLSLNPIELEPGGSTLGIVVTDLAQQKQQQQAIQLNETRFRSVFEDSLLGLRMEMADGTVTVNQALCDILGYTEQELLGKSWRDVTHPEDVLATEQARQDVWSGVVRNARLEKRHIHKSGETVWGDVIIGLGRDAAGRPLYLLTAINDITARKRSDQALRELQQHLQHNIEFERLRLAQELHDVPLQQLYGVLYRLDELRSEARPRTANVIEAIAADLQRVLDSLRIVATDLRPPALSRFGLEKAIRSYAATYCERHPHVQVRTSLTADGDALPEHARLALYRVLQEAFANITRHSQASQVDVRFSFDAEAAYLEIADNGRGFAVPEDLLSMVRKGHYGLAGMAERVSAAGGRLEIKSAPGVPTTIRAILPYGER